MAPLSAGFIVYSALTDKANPGHSIAKIHISERKKYKWNIHTISQLYSLHRFGIK